MTRVRRAVTGCRLRRRRLAEQRQIARFGTRIGHKTTVCCITLKTAHLRSAPAASPQAIVAPGVAATGERLAPVRGKFRPEAQNMTQRTGIKPVARQWRLMRNAKKVMHKSRPARLACSRRCLSSTCGDRARSRARRKSSSPCRAAHFRIISDIGSAASPSRRLIVVHEPIGAFA
jgi:hypothetical protein